MTPYGTHGPGQARGGKGYPRVASGPHQPAAFPPGGRAPFFFVRWDLRPYCAA